MNKNTEEKSALSIVKWISETYLSYGILVEDDFKDIESLCNKLLKVLPNEDITFVKDHTESLLDKAYYYFKKNEYDISIMFYATYFEHELNRIISHTLRKGNTALKSINELIRTVNISGKNSWLLDILGLPPIFITHVKTINEISAERNSFIHYKWNTEWDRSNNSPKFDLLVKAKKASTYLKKYSAKIMYDGKKKKISNYFKSKPIK